MKKFFRHKKGPRKIFIVFAVFGVIYLIFSLYSHFILPQALLLTKNKVLAYTNICINKAVEKAIAAENNDIRNICDIKYAQNGTVTYIAADGTAVNRFCGIIAEELSKMLVDGESTVRISSGSFTGIPFLADKGPEIPVNISCSGGITADSSTEIKTVGINQVSFGLFINIHADIHTYNPLINSIISLDRRVMLAEMIYPGTVPEVYGTGSTAVHSR